MVRLEPRAAPDNIKVMSVKVPVWRSTTSRIPSATENQPGVAKPIALSTTASAIMATAIVMWVVALLYFAFMESSKTQGSLGKMAMSIKVTDMDGQRVSFGKAFLRNIGKIVSQMILYIGYLMAAFTEKKQALHDIMAGTLVVKKYVSAIINNESPVNAEFFFSRSLIVFPLSQKAHIKKSTFLFDNVIFAGSSPRISPSASIRQG